MKFVRENPDIVKENIKKKFQDYKLPLVNEVLMEDKELRQTQQHADDLRANRKKISKEIGKLMGQGKKEEAEEIKQQMAEIAHELTALEEKEIKLRESVACITVTQIILCRNAIAAKPLQGNNISVKIIIYSPLAPTVCCTCTASRIS